MMTHDDITLELARIVREAEARVHAKLAARQLGEAFIGIESEIKPLEKLEGLAA